MGTAAEDANGSNEDDASYVAGEIDHTHSLDLSTRDLAALKDGYSRLNFGSVDNGAFTTDQMIFGNAAFRDEAVFYADEIFVRGRVDLTQDPTDVLGNPVELFARIITIEVTHLHTSGSALNSGIAANAS